MMFLLPAMSILDSASRTGDAARKAFRRKFRARLRSQKFVVLGRGSTVRGALAAVAANARRQAKILVALGSDDKLLLNRLYGRIGASRRG